MWPFSIFYTPSAPVNSSSRPTVDFVPDKEPFTTYHKKRLEQFNHHLEALQKHDHKITAASAVTFFSWWLSNSTFLVTTLGFVASSSFGYLYKQRQALQVNYQNALKQLKDDLHALNSSGLLWRDIIEDQQIQEIFKTLAPFVKKDELKYWQDEDLKAEGLLGTIQPYDRSDIPEDFIRLLRRVDDSLYETSWQYKLYGSNGDSDIMVFIINNFQKYVKNGVKELTSIFLNNQEVTQSDWHAVPTSKS